MKNRSLNHHITEECSDVALATNGKAICASAVLIIAGTALFYSSFTFGPEADSIAMLCFVLGIFAVALGLIWLGARRTKLVYLPTGSRLKHRSYYYGNACTGQIKSLAAGCHHNAAAPQCDHNGTVRLDVLVALDGSFVAAQVLSYADYAFTPLTPIYCHTGNAAAAFISKLPK